MRWRPRGEDMRPRHHQGHHWRGSRPTLGVDRVESIGPALRDLRLSQEVTQADVADTMDTTHPTTVGAWENGRVIPGVRKLIEVLAAFDYQLVFMHRKTLEAMIKPQAHDG